MANKSMGMATFWAILAFLMSLLIVAGLIDVLTVRASIFNGFSVLGWASFGNATVELVYAWIIGVVGTISALALLTGTIRLLFKR